MSNSHGTRGGRLAQYAPARREICAQNLGADELVALLEWELRNHPRALRNVRYAYRKFCLRLLARLERAR